MEPVCKFDNHHLQLGRSPAEDLAMHQFFKGLAVAGVVGHLGAALDNGLDVGTELAPDYLAGDFLDVLDRVMKQGSGQNLGMANIEFLGQNSGHRAGVHDIGISGTAPLFAMCFYREVEGLPEHLRLRAIADEAAHHLPVFLYIKSRELH